MNSRLKIQRLKILIAGVCSLMLMLGIARFAYTPMMPLMQQQAGLGVAAGGWLASINYLGYLSGVLLAASISNLSVKFRLYRLGIVLAVLTTAAMALTSSFYIDQVYLWAVMRYLAGFSSAAGVMFGSGLILHWLLKNNLRSELGIHFSGAGLGIALGALIIELSSQLSWQQQWWLLALLGLLLALPAWCYLPRPSAALKAPQSLTATTVKVAVTGRLAVQSPSLQYLRLFMAFYACAGVGYVISATFIVAIIDSQTSKGESSSGNFAFLLLGLAAAPACIVWDLVARRMGDLNTLIIVSLLHIISIILPLLQHTLWAAYASTLLFGATFIGLVSLVLSMAGRYYPASPAKMMGKMTLGYCVAQILAPAIIAVMVANGGTYREGLLLGAGAMVLGVGFLWRMKTSIRSAC
tara:strand:+ start:5801 stop:7030 length:1230 start_codon:yes stop_codon:yes gene_type:complete